MYYEKLSCNLQFIWSKVRHCIIREMDTPVYRDRLWPHHTSIDIRAELAKAHAGPLREIEVARALRRSSVYKHVEQLVMMIRVLAENEVVEQEKMTMPK